MTRISAYTTLRNAREMDYPFVESIQSALGFADEVVVFDSSNTGKSSDGTIDSLLDLQNRDSRVIVVHEDIDWEAPNHGILDGETKARARAKCTGDYLIQFDSDEVFHENQTELWKEAVERLNQGTVPSEAVMAFPVIEFWGNRLGKVRLDINLEKPRLSRNLPSLITHGIPGHLRKYSKTGLLYACPGTDTCDYIHSVTHVSLPWITTIPEYIRKVQQFAQGDVRAALHLQTWFNSTITTVPSVYHYSWFSIKRKMDQYRRWWTTFWKAMYDLDRDPRDNPFFPGRTWEEVSEKEMEELAVALEEKTGGHIFHSPWDGFERQSMYLTLGSHPAVMDHWRKEHSSR